VQLLRTKYKPGRKLTAYYRLRIGAEARPIALTWSVESLSDAMDAADRQDQTAPRHLVAPFERLSARTDAGHMGLLIAPLDPQMPQLMRLSQHSHLTAMLREVAADVAVLPGAPRVQAVRYRPGQRHVLRVSAKSDHDGPAVYVKVDRDNRSERAVRFAELVGPLLAERSPGTGLVTPLGFVAADLAAVWLGTAGATMSQELRDPRRAAPLLTLIGRAVRALHDLEPQVVTSAMADDQWSEPHDARSELTSTLGAGQLLTSLLPAVWERYSTLAREAVEQFEDLPAEEVRLGHGDLKCDNIIAAGDRICLLDLDRSGLADPAMDLGKVLADLCWWARQHSVDETVLVAGLLEGYGPCDPARLARARLIAVLYQLKLGARRTPVHAVDWAGQITRQVDQAAASLRGETVR
jgi:hypothetical protein